jgi:hypothetical protein
MDMKCYGPAGKRLMRQVLEQLKEDQLEPDAREAELLKQAATLADRLDQIRQTLASEGLTVATAKGGPRAHPLLAVERATVAAIQRLLDGISLTEEPIKNAAKQRAARTRWRAHNAARARS